MVFVSVISKSIIKTTINYVTALILYVSAFFWINSSRIYKILLSAANLIDIKNKVFKFITKNGGITYILYSCNKINYVYNK